MKKLVNVYSYELEYFIDKTSRKVTSMVKDYIKSQHKKRDYNTKMKPSDLPEHYCDVRRYCNVRNCINAQGITDLKYSWVKENHFMKDSVLRISYSGNLEPYYDEYVINGKKVKSLFVSYKNEDAIIFGNDIFKFLGYAKKYSNFDVTKIKNEFINQCDWLKENEPEFAPDTDNFAEWFDEKIKID